MNVAQLNGLLKENADLKAKIAQVEESHDKEIGAFQDEVRNLVLDMSGAPDESIDGKGSDGGWQDLTLAEISQGLAFLKDRLAQVEARWTNSPPTVPGWYWKRGRVTGFIEIQEITKSDLHLEYRRFHFYDWSGPLPEPHEPPSGTQTHET